MALDDLLAYENHWPTTLGKWSPGETVEFRGRDLFAELGRSRWMELLLFGICGRKFTENQIRLFEGMWVLSTSYPDPRLWNNRIAALAGSARSTAALGVAGGTAVSEAVVYGFRPMVAVFDLLARLVRHRGQGGELGRALDEEIARREAEEGRPGRGMRRRIAALPGYGRPIVTRDERITPLSMLARDLGLDGGEHTTMAFAVEEALIAEGREWRMNISALMAGLAADQGLTAAEFGSYVIHCFSAGMLPCYIDALTKPENALFPLRCSRIRYEGPERREWR